MMQYGSSGCIIENNPTFKDFSKRTMRCHCLAAVLPFPKQSSNSKCSMVENIVNSAIDLG